MPQLAPDNDQYRAQDVYESKVLHITEEGEILRMYGELGQRVNRFVAGPLFPYSAFRIPNLILHKGLVRQNVDHSLSPGMPAELSDRNSKQVVRSGHARSSATWKQAFFSTLTRSRSTTAK